MRLENSPDITRVSVDIVCKLCGQECMNTYIIHGVVS